MLLGMLVCKFVCMLGSYAGSFAGGCPSLADIHDILHFLYIRIFNVQKMKQL